MPEPTVDEFEEVPMGFTLCGDFVGYRQQKSNDGQRIFLFVTIDTGDGPDDRIEFLDGIEGLEEYIRAEKGHRFAFPVRVSARLNRGAAAVSISRVRPRK